MSLFIILYVVALAIIGMFIEEIILLYEKKHSKVPNMLIKASKGSINVVSKGLGNITVVFSSGYGCTSPYCDFYNLQESVSKFTKTALYERYGYGYSDDIFHGITIDNLVEDIRLSLKKRGHTPPYIFFAHSMASIEVLRYAQMYPYEVMGIVLEDGLNPEINESIPLPNNIVLRFMQFFKFTGILRLAIKFPYLKSKFISFDSPKEIIKLKTRLTKKNFWNENMVYEMKNLNLNCSTVLNYGTDFKSLPIQIVTAGNRTAYSEKTNALWLQSQKNMLSFSTNSNQLIVEGSNHFIHDNNNNDILISAIKSVLNLKLKM